MTFDEMQKTLRFRRFVGRVREKVLRERVFITTLPCWLTETEPEWKHLDFCCVVAQSAGCDWLYDRKSGETRFFEYA